jgi:hypothetical protein
MAEAVKQFFVGFIHPRTWLAAILGLVVAAIAGLALAGTLIDTLVALGSLPPTLISDLKGIALGVFLVVLFTYSALIGGSATPLIIVIISAFIAGLIFGLLSKKERVASKSIIGGLNIALIYMVIVVLATIVWLIGFSGFGALYTAVVTFLQGAPLDILVTFLVVWWVTTIVSMLILSVKHD